MASFLCWTICRKASGLKGVEALDIGLGNHKEVLDHGEAVVEPMSALEGKRRHGGAPRPVSMRGRESQLRQVVML